MKIKQKIKFVLTLIILILVTYGCKKGQINTLKVSPENIVIEKEGGFASISITTDANEWSIENPVDWIQLSNTSGTQKTALVTLVVSEQTTQNRTATLRVKSGNATPVEVVVSQQASEFIYTLTSNLTELKFKRKGNSLTFKVTTDASVWNLTDEGGWLQFNTTSGGSGSTFVNVTAQQNTGTEARNATIKLSAEFAQEFIIQVTQNGELYPSYNTNPIPPDASGMESTAMEIAAQMNIGWNIGNSLEASGGETGWGNPMVSPALIQLVKQSGFNTIRIPCAFNQYVENAATAKIKESWLNRVKNVVQYCIDQDLYVILNIHWDGGWLENNISEAAEEAVNAKQKAFWEQIATHLRDFDQRLLFASANEPDAKTPQQMAILNSYHQSCIDAVRSTGGRNAYRTIVVQGPVTDVELTNSLMNTLPVDVVENRMMVEVHYYTPWNFCGMTSNESWGSMFYYWGEGYHSATDPQHNATFGEEATVDANFALMKNKFVNNGIPVVLGEYSVTRRSALTGENLELHLASRAYYFYYVTKKAKENGLIPFYWDNGYMGNHGCAIFNRISNTVFDQQALDALIQGANEKK